MDPRISDYIRANRRKYTREAITQQLVAAGHDPAEVERVWAALDAPDADRVAGEGFWGRFALIVVGINLAVLLLLGLLTGALQNAGQGGLILLIVLAVVLGIGALIAWGIVAVTGPANMSPTTALVIGTVIPLLFALLIGGSCYALIGGMGGGFSGASSQAGTMTVTLTGPVQLDAKVEAQCQPFGATPAEGFGVHGVTRDPEGREVAIDLTTHPAGAGGSLDSFVSIALDPSDPESGAFWSNEGPTSGTRGGTIEYAEGRFEFTELQGFSNLSGEPLDPLSGEIAWLCGQ
jgi:hypothetical protein